MMLEIENLQKAFGSRQVLRGLGLQLERGEIGVLLGESGSGKTTLLRLIAGFERAESGRIAIDGKTLGASVHPSERGIGFLFQNFGLFPHLRASENISLALKALSSQERVARLEEVLKLCGLEHEQNRFPHELSGGQQQRLALARALAPRPQLLLMDEPFSSLDPGLRSHLSQEVRALLKSQGLTSLIVTHHIDEAYDLADRIGIIDSGRILQMASAYDLYHRPSSPFVARYLEAASFLDVVIDERGEVWLGVMGLGISKNLLPAGAAKLLIRPDDVLFDETSSLCARVIDRRFRGAWHLYDLELEGHGRLLSYAPSHRVVASDRSVGIRFEFDQLICFSSI